jgi:hypothetical protein
MGTSLQAEEIEKVQMAFQEILQWQKHTKLHD